jgi:hypothetical protein
MTPEQLRANMNSSALREIVQKQTNLLCDAYQQDWNDCMDLFTRILKERGIEL